MSSRPPGAPLKALTDLDHRIEAAVGRSIDTLWKQCDRGLLDEPHTRLVEAHRALVQAVTGVTFYRTLLGRLAGGEFPVDQALFERIDRAVHQLEEAAGARDERQRATLSALESVEADAPRADVAGVELSARDFAALLAIARGAHLREHLLTGQLSVVTASGTRIPPSVLDRLERSGLVERDTAHPVIAGQPVTLTDAGRTTLTSRRPAGVAATASSPRAGAWPPTSPRARK
ncbi:hypothetical protein [Streptomyces sp. IB2014 016-6]|uniref:hypothetical protein n=1 Tax=Streptomyces sp. IB2014 016-6 TaxID=2517818 RepID=UPI0011CBF146|nr:hypothetical protein [Streptomyces sp. IB2014 016-6]TXL84207.1 hypothetical protein EW053_35215 [Streptomyces sp. IB2014 016-6]